ncbi:1-phosphofructokinase [Aquibacillus salsiterrae]|uniref:Tagatose-6-phosphate kinase n=1 Tax=Aquibacillus salsiterrae TaxID=2950439 RepID=A0A9X3WBJ1_9BACI|nr:1-phosphofructokinase [Aquibacillus salsiterrae]MDC3416187.1 1-phosphofructokinase [Aquibacillus salsiterrae]
MIYTCTLNPSVDYILHVDEFQTGELNRGYQPSYYPGGKGINVSRVLRRLGVDNTALGFLGGFTGTYIDEKLSSENIAHSFISISGDTRINLKLKSSVETEVNGPGPIISEAELDELLSQIKAINAGDYLVASGSIPTTVPTDFYSMLASICEQNNVHFIVDTSSQALKEIIGSKLFLIKPNHHELGELFETTIRSYEDAVHFGKKLQRKGAIHVIISMGGDGAVYVGEHESYYAKAPTGQVKNTVGAGDSMVSGFLSAYTKSANPKKAFQYAIASGSATAFSDDLCTKDDVKKILDQVLVTSID